MIAFNLNAQKKRAADDYFKRLAYVKAAELYEKVFRKGDSSTLTLTRLGDSYYYNSKTKKSEYWYQKLFSNTPNDEIPSEYFFRYAQSLKSNGKYKESDFWLTKFRQVNSSDSRGEKLELKKDYLSKYSVQNSQFVHITNLNSNTKYSDFGAFILGDKIYFASSGIDTLSSKKYSWNNQPFLNLYRATEVFSLNKEIVQPQFEKVIKVRNLKGINSRYHEASAVLTKDGNTMYFTRDNFNNRKRKLKTDKKRTSNLKIYKAIKRDSVWDNIEELPFNSDDYSTGHPSLSVDEKELYFVSDMPGGFGSTDIYKVEILSDSTYSNPKNLGKTINTEGREMFPFVSSDGILYFSSDGHLGLGLLDVFSSKITGDTYNGIENLGNPINSAKDDFAFVLNQKNTRGYFSSNREGGKGDDDIYAFSIKKATPPCSQDIVGEVKDKVTNQLISGASVTLFDVKNQKIDSVIVGNDAAFKFTLPCDGKYKLVGFKRYFKPNVQTFTTGKGVGVLTAKKMDLVLNDDFRYSEKIEMIINIKPIYFDLNSAKIRPDAIPELNKVVAVMRKYPELIIQSRSHTDSRGREQYNLTLSEKRAISTVKYVISKGISADRISGKGYGETELVNECKDGVKCSNAKHQLNRRTEFVIILKDQ